VRMAVTRWVVDGGGGEEEAMWHCLCHSRRIWDVSRVGYRVCLFCIYQSLRGLVGFSAAIVSMVESSILPNGKLYFLFKLVRTL
jgi:hypothetical protein